VGASGDGAVNQSETYAWTDFMKTNNISNANWALNDKAEGSSALVGGASTTGGWPNNQLTTSGSLVRSIVQSWPQFGGGSSSTSSSSSSAAAVGTQIEAENYANMSGIQTEATSDTGGGKNVGWIDAGDWMTYPVNIPTAGSYLVSYRVASLNGGGVISLEKAGGSPVYGTTNVSSTGGWQTWVTITQVVNLAAGQQTLAISAPSGGYNLNWFKIDAIGGSSSSASSSSSSSSSSNTTPLATVQAESYSYMSGIQTEATSDAGGGLDVGWTDAGDWLSYINTPVNIPTSGTYTIAFRVASAVGGGKISFEEAGGGAVYGVANVSNTGGWQNWTTVKLTVNLTAGSHKFGLGIPAGGWNLNWFSITQGAN
jgi:endoglucanase